MGIFNLRHTHDGYFNLIGYNSPPLAAKKRVLLLHQDTPLLAAGRFIEVNYNDQGNPPNTPFTKGSWGDFHINLQIVNTQDLF